MDFATQLRTLRQARNLTQEQLAVKAGIPNTYISSMETGKVIPAGAWLAQLRAALGWTDDTDGLLALLHHSSADLTDAYRRALAGPCSAQAGCPCPPDPDELLHHASPSVTAQYVAAAAA